MSSHIDPATINDIANSLDISKLAPEAAKALAPDAEYRMRELIQDALKFARHSRRSLLTVEDVNNALRTRNAEPLYGFSNKDPAKYIKAAGQPDLYCMQDKELSIEQLVDTPLSKPPVEVGVMPHWLFIDGVQPAVPENAPLEKQPARRPKAAPARKEGAKPVDAKAPGTPAAAQQQQQQQQLQQQQAQQPQSVHVQPTVQHVLSRELQLYFIKVVDIIKQAMAEGISPLRAPPPGKAAETARMLDAVLASLASDPGLHPLTPYLVKFCGDEVAASLRSPNSLHVLLRLADALLRNEDIKLEPYVHQLLPALLTCLVARNIGVPPPLAQPSPSIPTSQNGSGPHPPNGPSTSAPAPQQPPGAPAAPHSTAPNNSTPTPSEQHTAGTEHWAVRDRAAALVRTVCMRFGDPYYNLQPRVSKTLLRALLDPSKPLTTHYGAIVGLAALGHMTVRLLLLPQLQPYMEQLQPLLEPPQVDGPQLEAPGAPQQSSASIAARAAARSDAWRVYNALLDAVAYAMRERVIEQADALVAASRPRLSALKHASRSHVKQEEGVAPQENGVAQHKEQAPIASKGNSASAMEVDEEQQQQQQQQQQQHHHQKGMGALAGEDGPAKKRARLGKRSVREVLAEAWREDADLEEVMAALQELMGPDLLARMPLSQGAVL